LRKGEADLAEFRFVRTDLPFYRLLTEFPGFVMRGRFPQAQPHWIMRLPDRPEAVPTCISSHEKRQIRRRAKMLETEYPGKVRIERFGPGSDLASMFLDLEEVAKKTYHRGLGVGFVDTPETRERLRFEADKGWMRVRILYVADKPCAFWMGNLYGDIFYSGDVGYDPLFRKYELGKQVLMKLLEDLCKENTKQVDFGLGDADWKHRFGDEKWDEASLTIFAPTLKGSGINLLRTTTILAEQTAKRALERTQTLSRLKKLWRGRATKEQKVAGGDAEE
jgi:Acetyltransferase (GNAT) domain